ncbi:hypothetical protein [Burkholderia territorii]|uniref:hypothetical protein n=1 Tax=Burkholderia territorii TaxID=1503055 RepID=UPI0018C50456|nr:hypothetical protein [Burkholderia territorii]
MMVKKRGVGDAEHPAMIRAFAVAPRYPDGWMPGGIVQAGRARNRRDAGCVRAREREAEVAGVGRGRSPAAVCGAGAAAAVGRGKAFAFANVKLKSRVSAVDGRQRRCAVPAQRRPGGGDRRSSARQPWPHARARILE